MDSGSANWICAVVEKALTSLMDGADGTSGKKKKGGVTRKNASLQHDKLKKHSSIPIAPFQQPLLAAAHNMNAVSCICISAHNYTKKQFALTLITFSP